MNKLLLIIYCAFNGYMLGTILADSFCSLEFKMWLLFFCSASMLWLILLSSKLDDLERERKKKDGPEGMLLFHGD
jgi:hypothetical protein